jgi:hypothetical protein
MSEINNNIIYDIINIVASVKNSIFLGDVSHSFFIDKDLNDVKIVSVISDTYKNVADKIENYFIKHNIIYIKFRYEKYFQYLDKRIEIHVYVNSVLYFFIIYGNNDICIPYKLAYHYDKKLQININICSPDMQILYYMIYTHYYTTAFCSWKDFKFNLTSDKNKNNIIKNY